MGEWAIRCPKCGSTMREVSTVSIEPSGSVLRCADIYREGCKHEEPLPTHVLLERLKAPKLPGFGE